MKRAEMEREREKEWAEHEDRQIYSVRQWGKQTHL